MAFFWQLTGCNSHFRNNWRVSKDEANKLLAETVFDASSTKDENGFCIPIDLILGIEESGASHILLPIPLKQKCRSLNWRVDYPPYPASKYASLSPIRIDSPLRLEALIEERKNTAKNTKASKIKTDNSKANGRFSNVAANLGRASFEHERCLWRIMNKGFQPGLYGLPDAPWSKKIVIFSLVLNFWKPDGGKPVDTLLDAAVSKLDENSVERLGQTWYTTWYFKAEEHVALRNVSSSSAPYIPETWNSSTLPEHEIGHRIAELLDSHSKIGGEQVLPVVILVHNYDRFHREQLNAHGVSNIGWISDIAQLLGFQTLSHRCKIEETKTENMIKDRFSSRARSRSPTRRDSKAYVPKREKSPFPSYHDRSIYVVDVLTKYQIVAGNPARIRPVDVYNNVRQEKKLDTGSAGDDANFILDSWKAMAEGPSIDEQNAFIEDYTRRVALEAREYPNNASEQPEDTGLFAPAIQNNVEDNDDIFIFNDGSDSDH
ncbi:hypothetical protein BU17DRAFT_97494 [Hysterangium stoloniferum]|nr:hypothetical protein BU17DRAFT_97494 [Hysterangium stoloniferum]